MDFIEWKQEMQLHIINTSFIIQLPLLIIKIIV